MRKLEQLLEDCGSNALTLEALAHDTDTTLVEKPRIINEVSFNGTAGTTHPTVFWDGEYNEGERRQYFFIITPPENLSREWEVICGDEWEVLAVDTREQLLSKFPELYMCTAHDGMFAVISVTHSLADADEQEMWGKLYVAAINNRVEGYTPKPYRA